MRRTLEPSELDNLHSGRLSRDDWEILADTYHMCQHDWEMWDAPAANESGTEEYYRLG